MSKEIIVHTLYTSFFLWFLCTVYDKEFRTSRMGEKDEERSKRSEEYKQHVYYSTQILKRIIFFSVHIDEV